MSTSTVRFSLKVTASSTFTVAPHQITWWFSVRSLAAPTHNYTHSCNGLFIMRRLQSHHPFLFSQIHRPPYCFLHYTVRTILHVRLKPVYNNNCIVFWQTSIILYKFQCQSWNSSVCNEYTKMNTKYVQSYISVSSSPHFTFTQNVNGTVNHLRTHECPAWSTHSACATGTSTNLMTRDCIPN